MPSQENPRLDELEELLKPLRRRAADEAWNEDYRGGINDVMREVDRFLPALLATARREERLQDGLERIRDNLGNVCETYPDCEDIGCEQSKTAWVVADSTLRSAE